MKPLDAIAIFTADRPHLALRCAESYLTNHTHPRELLLMDDSRSDGSIPDLAAHLRQTYKLPVVCIDRAARSSYIHHLTRAGVPPDVTAFTLLGNSCASFTAGANRNAALLRTVGQQFLMADDDTVATTAVPGPSEIEFFPPGAARAAARWSPVDLVTETAALLDSTIRLASCGVVGDSGYFSPSHFLWLCAPHVYEKLRQSEPLLNIALTSREVIRIAPGLTITDTKGCMATTLGLNHTHPLPPFLPLGRNEDGFFGNLMHRIFPTARLAHLPCAVLHDPPGTRIYNRLPHEPQSLRFSELLMLLMAKCPAATFQAIGQFLVETSVGDHLESFARDTVRKSREGILRLIEHRHATAATPATAEWLRQTESLKASFTAFIESRDCWLPSDIPAPELPRIISLTGRMLIHWNEMLAAARERPFTQA